MKTPFHFGKHISSDDANFHGDFPYGGVAKSTWLNRTSAVGSNKKPNGYGLHDMHGNVSEWCSDWSGEKYYADSPASDPPGASEGSNRVHRGGSWSSSGGGCRSAYRSEGEPWFRYYTRGFRVALVPFKE